MSANPQTTEIAIPFGEAAHRHLQISVGACRLRPRPGGDPAWVGGTYTDPTGALPARVTVEDGQAWISQLQNLAEVFGLFRSPPSFDPRLGAAQPYQMTIETGASETEIDLDGLPIARLVVRQGAGRGEIDFSAANPIEMQAIDLSAGAVSLTVRRLANANAAEIRIDGGAAGYLFDFDGTLRRDAHARISTGVSSIELAVPASTAARISHESSLGAVEIGDG